MMMTEMVAKIPEISADKLRQTLEKEMGKRGWNAYDMERESGVPQPTIWRFLSGKHDDLRTKNVEKMAKAMGLTEGQLRGFEPTVNKNTLEEGITGSFTFCERLQQARKARGLNKYGLATKVGVSRASATDWENGNIKSLSADNLLKICKALQINPYWLMYGTGDMDLIDGQVRGVESVPGDKSNDSFSVEEPQTSETERYLHDVITMCRRLIDSGCYPDDESSWRKMFADVFELVAKFNYPDLLLLEKLFLNKVGGS